MAVLVAVVLRGRAVAVESGSVVRASLGTLKSCGLSWIRGVRVCVVWGLRCSVAV